jgi:hypothetical protein
MGGRKMKKIIGLLCVVLLSFGIVGCGKSDVDLKPDNATEKSSTPSVAKVEEPKTPSKLYTFISALKSNGIIVSGERKVGAEIIGAKEGYKFIIKGKEIEIYQFDLTSNAEMTIKNLKSLKDTSEISLKGIDEKRKAKQNGDMIILGQEDTKDKDKIESIFNSFK